MPNSAPLLHVCGACRQSLPVSEFAWKDKAKGRLQSKCKPCARAYAKSHYEDNKALYLEKAARHNLAVRGRNKRIEKAAKVGRSCVACDSTKDLTFYVGGIDAGQPVHQAVHGGLSEAAVIAAVNRSEVFCRTCLRSHFGDALRGWMHLSEVERKSLRAERKAACLLPTPKSAFKKYRAAAPA